MPPKRKATAHRQHGQGFFGDVWKGMKTVGKFIKANKLVSKGLGLIPHPHAQAASRAAAQLGLGKRRRAPRKNLIVMK